MDGDPSAAAAAAAADTWRVVDFGFSPGEMAGAPRCKGEPGAKGGEEGEAALGDAMLGERADAADDTPLRNAAAALDAAPRPAPLIMRRATAGRAFGEAATSNSSSSANGDEPTAAPEGECSNEPRRIAARRRSSSSLEAA